MKAYRDITQGTPEWLQLRKGRPTASRFSDILTSKGDVSKSSKGYIRELIGECFAPDFDYWGGNRFTDRGTEVEPLARAAFSELTGATVEQVGFCIHDNGVMGCSPDGLLVDAEGEFYAGLELKCPTPKVHVGYVLDGVLPDDYKQQVHGSMVVTGLTEWHFMSFFPNMKPFHLLVGWDDYTEKLAESLGQFIAAYKFERDIAIPKLQIK